MIHEIDTVLVEKLVFEQFPHLKELPVSPIERQGWDNRTFRLGKELSVRLPSHPSYADAVAKEATALDFLAGRLSVAVPKVIAFDW